MTVAEAKKIVIEKSARIAKLRELGVDATTYADLMAEAEAAQDVLDAAAKAKREKAMANMVRIPEDEEPASYLGRAVRKGGKWLGIEEIVPQSGWSAGMRYTIYYGKGRFVSAATAEQMNVGAARKRQVEDIKLELRVASSPDNYNAEAVARLTAELAALEGK